MENKYNLSMSDVWRITNESDSDREFFELMELESVEQEAYEIASICRDALKDMDNER